MGAVEIAFRRSSFNFSLPGLQSSASDGERQVQGVQSLHEISRRGASRVASAAVWPHTVRRHSESVVGTRRAAPTFCSAALAQDGKKINKYK